MKWPRMWTQRRGGGARTEPWGSAAWRGQHSQGEPVKEAEESASEQEELQEAGVFWKSVKEFQEDEL